MIVSYAGTLCESTLKSVSGSGMMDGKAVLPLRNTVIEG